MGIDGVNDAMPAVVAAVTAFINDDTLNKCYESGMVDVISKPVESKTLKNFVTKYYRGLPAQHKK